MTFENDFEGHVKKQLQDGHVEGFHPHVNSTNSPDFNIRYRTHEMWVELKEKKDPYNMGNWPDFGEMGIRETDAFIEDELSLRRLFFYGPYSYLVVKNRSAGKGRDKYHVFNILDIMCMPKKRNRRRVGQAMKGKWLLDLRWASAYDTIPDAFDSLLRTCEDIAYLCGVEERDQRQFTDCHGDYVGEIINEGGTPRSRYYRRKDLREK